MTNATTDMQRIIGRNLCLRLDVDADAYASFNRDTEEWLIRVVIAEETFDESIHRVQTLFNGFVTETAITGNTYAAYMTVLGANNFIREFGYV